MMVCTMASSPDFPRILVDNDRFTSLFGGGRATSTSSGAEKNVLVRSDDVAGRPDCGLSEGEEFGPRDHVENRLLILDDARFKEDD